MVRVFLVKQTWGKTGWEMGQRLPSHHWPHCWVSPGPVPVPWPVMGRRAVKGLHGRQQPLTGWHGRWKADVFRVQRLVLMIFQLQENTAVTSCWSPHQAHPERCRCRRQGLVWCSGCPGQQSAHPALTGRPTLEADKSHRILSPKKMTTEDMAFRIRRQKEP